ncbi:hypothetical protein [Amantichitinum ursilacus]|uniref:Uncharacterized protein n=1 Tax=Amantichitinum ursilacus TaxID=857265 RepID=A0A0N0GQG4_9NEIS|nr:hypothetical protein [Amantichitinum ursilacus]KPC54762.1 hypothetical protein WG78_04295 [Amantichitinum ursilacus]
MKPSYLVFAVALLGSAGLAVADASSVQTSRSLYQQASSAIDAGQCSQAVAALEQFKDLRRNELRADRDLASRIDQQLQLCQTAGADKVANVLALADLSEGGLAMVPSQTVAGAQLGNLTLQPVRLNMDFSDRAAFVPQQN